MARNKKTKALKRRAIKAQTGIGPQPPALRTLIETTHTYRYYTTTGAGVAISQNSILISCGAVATAAASLASIWGSFKIVRVRAWAPPATAGTLNQITMSYFGNLLNAGGDAAHINFNDVSINPSVPAHLDTRPPSGTYATQWQSAGTIGYMFELSAPAGTLVDFTVQLKVYDPSFAGVLTTRATASTIGATVGNIYLCPLDNLTNDYQPVGVTNTINQI